MSRIGITYLEVENAVKRLQGKGETPTIERVRQILGTGSNSTIAKYLREYLGENKAAEVTNLPSEMTEMMSGLWERVQERAEQRIMEIEQACQEKIKALENERVKVQKEAKEYQAQVNRLEKEYFEQTETHKGLLEKLLAVESHGSILKEQKESLEQQLNHERMENDRLHRLLNNVQKNLEHYQGAIQKLQQEQTLSLEKERAKYNGEIAQLRQQLVNESNEKNAVRLEFEKMVGQFETAQQVYEKIENQIRALEQELKDKAIKERILEEKIKEMTAKSKADAIEIETKTKALAEAQKKLAVFENRIEGLERSLKQMEDKVQNLQQERLFMTQENAELKGQLKQIHQSHKEQVALNK